LCILLIFCLSIVLIIFTIISLIFNCSKLRFAHHHGFFTINLAEEAPLDLIGQTHFLVMYFQVDLQVDLHFADDALRVKVLFEEEINYLVDFFAEACVLGQVFENVQ